MKRFPQSCCALVCASFLSLSSVTSAKDHHEKYHYFLGGSVDVGVAAWWMVDAEENPRGLDPSLFFEVTGGLMLGHIELSLSISPLTSLPILIDNEVYSTKPTLSVLGQTGYHIPLCGNFSWPVRLGIGFDTFNVKNIYAEAPILFATRIQAIGLGYTRGQWIFEIGLPARYNTNLSDSHIASWLASVRVVRLF